MTRDRTTPRSILFVCSDTAITTSITSCLNDEGFLVSVETSKDAALDHLGLEPFDCLVIDPAVSDSSIDEFVTALRSTEADCPVVWLPAQQAEPVEDDELDVPTTIVEQGSVTDDCSFLVEKITGIISTDSPRGADASTFKTLVESASDGFYTLDAAARVTYLNESFAEMLGYERDELAGMHAANVMAEGELERGQQRVQALITDDDRDSDVMDMDMVAKDGTPVTVSVHYSVLTGDDGTYKGLMGVVRDVTDRTQRERELARERERLEEFASAVSHDLRSPLSVAKGHVELAREDRDHESLAKASAALDRMERLLTDVLELARQGETVDETDRVVLADAVDEARALLPDTTTLHDEFEGMTVHADRTRLIEVFENLFENTVQHAGADSTIRVGPLDGGHGLFVEDDGPGIPERNRDSVFDHGYTTGRDGTGFGLSITNSIVDAHGWEITVTDGEFGGARFEITGME